MRDDSCQGNLVRLLLPAAAIAIAYTLFAAVPQRRELELKRAAVADALATNAQLQQRLDGLADRRPATDLRSQRLISTANPISEPHVAVSETNPQTAARAFGQAIDILKSRGIDCITATHAGQDKSRQAALLHQLSLQGDFASMIAALDQIATDIPHATVTQLRLERINPAESCRWQVSIRFAEAVE